MQLFLLLQSQETKLWSVDNREAQVLYQTKKLRTRLMKVITRKKISKGIVQTEENHIHLVHTETIHNLYPRQLSLSAATISIRGNYLYPRQLVLDLTFRRLRRQNVATFSQESSFFIKQQHSFFIIHNQSAVC
jgi:hypothetical protein